MPFHPEEDVQRILEMVSNERNGKMKEDIENVGRLQQAGGQRLMPTIADILYGDQGDKKHNHNEEIVLTFFAQHWALLMAVLSVLTWIPVVIYFPVPDKPVAIPGVSQPNPILQPHT